jgi:hypothetical protein
MASSDDDEFLDQSALMQSVINTEGVAAPFIPEDAQFDPSTPPKNDCIENSLDGVRDFRVIDGQTLKEQKAQTFVAAIQKGMSPGKAAKEIGTTLKQLNTRADMKAAIKNLLEVAALNDEVTREVVRAGRVKIFMEGVISDDPTRVKLALEASKQIGADLGIGSGEANVVIDLGSLGQAISDVSLPGINNPFKPLEGTQNKIDGEAEHDKR